MSSDLHDKSVWDAVPPLHGAGFALHWLKPRAKAPIGKDWQNRDRPTMDQLRATHVAGANLGVRLGEPSSTPAGYLHLFDLDIRIPDVAEECWAALRKLLPGVDLDALPQVQSGSGGDSRHVYFVTDKPFTSRLVATSEGKHCREKIDPKTGKPKQVWSFDWEIEFYGTGKQVVLPPSIHPDTGQAYAWLNPFDFDLLDLGLGPTIPSAEIEALGAVEATTFAFEAREPLEFKPGQLESDLAAIDVSELHYDDWVRLGQALHHQFGGSDEGFDLWLLHTRRSKKFTGESQAREMRRVKWRSFGKYRGQPVTMGTIRSWAQEARSAALAAEFDDLDADAAFDDDDAVDDEAVDPLADLLGDTTAAPTSDPFDDDAPVNKELVAETAASDWLSLLDLNEEGAIKPTLHNLRFIVANDPRWSSLVAFNEFTQEIVQRGSPGQKSQRRRAAKATLQLEGPNWKLRDEVNGDFWTEDKDNAIRALIEAPKSQGGYGIKVADRDLRGALDIAGRRNTFHPVREFLESLTWDGQQRVETLFIDYLGSPDDSYTRSIGRLMMVAAVTRVFEPGAKFDFAVILEGIQGKRKSTFINVLAKNWFAELDGDFEDARVMVELMQGSWLLEIPELSGFAKADVRHIKAFISRRTDKVRLAYARRAQEYPRQCVFIGSTNDSVYLKDETGGRRFWPVSCAVDDIDTDRLEGEVDQLWAEAVTLYRQMRAQRPHGTLPLYLADEHARLIAERLQESRKVESTEDALAGEIAEWLARPINTGGFDDEDVLGQPRYRTVTCLREIWAECLGKDLSAFVGAWPMTLGRAMRLVPDWEMTGDRPRFGKYGQQRAFKRID